MRIALVHNARLPVQKYGGTERVVWWAAKGLHELGHRVVLVAAPGTACPFAEVRTADFSQPIDEQVPDVDVFHFFTTPLRTPDHPYLVTIGGNGKSGEHFPRNTVFVSRNHALRHGAQAFVYNGLDPSEYVFSNRKNDRLLFLAKARWKVKNVSGAIRIARKSRKGLDILGGSSWLSPWRGVHWRGMLGGTEKVGYLSRAQGLLFPVLWDEPFGLAVIEALVSGTPALVSPFGSLPELIRSSEVGMVCRTEAEFVQAAGDLGRYSAERCRAWVADQFTYRQMCRDYLRFYETVAAGGFLNKTDPMSSTDAGALRFLS